MNDLEKFLYTSRVIDDLVTLLRLLDIRAAYRKLNKIEFVGRQLRLGARWRIRAESDPETKDEHEKL